jgi:hypothetical protein
LTNPLVQLGPAHPQQVSIVHIEIEIKTLKLASRTVDSILNVVIVIRNRDLDWSIGSMICGVILSRNVVPVHRRRPGFEFLEVVLHGVKGHLCCFQEIKQKLVEIAPHETVLPHQLPADPRTLENHVSEAKEVGIVCQMER